MRVILVVMSLMLVSAEALAQELSPAAEPVADAQEVPLAVLDDAAWELARTYETHRTVAGGAGLVGGVVVATAGAWMLYQGGAERTLEAVDRAPLALTMVLGGSVATAVSVGAMRPSELELELEDFDSMAPEARAREGFGLLRRHARRGREQRLFVASVAGVSGLLIGGSSLWFSNNTLGPLPLGVGAVGLGLAAWYGLFPSAAEMVYADVLQGRVPGPRAQLLPSMELDPATGRAHTGVRLVGRW